VATVTPVRCLIKDKKRLKAEKCAGGGQRTTAIQKLILTIL